MMEWILVGGGLIAGLIDSVAGGGGLITLPLLSMALLPGAQAIATNKIVGTIGALTALYVYSKKGHLKIIEVWPFLVSIFFGSWLGSVVSPMIDPKLFRWVLIVACPFVLAMVIKGSTFVKINSQNNGSHGARAKKLLLAVLGVFCGFYDGSFGPGGGTLMLLSLSFIARMPLLSSVAASKLANSFSAGTALLSYQAQGYVHWTQGLLMSLGMFFGSVIGARAAIRFGHSVFRPALILAVTLLLSKLIFDAIR